MGYAPIYPRLKRDAIISHGLLHRTPLAEINDKLFSENEKTLFLRKHLFAQYMVQPPPFVFYVFFKDFIYT